MTNRDSADWDVYVANSDGTEARSLTSTMHMTALFHDYAWSPRGDRLAFLSPSGIRIATVAGSIGSAFTAPGLVTSYGWSPDGQYLTYSKTDPTDNRTEVWVATSDGTGTTHRISPAAATGSSGARWSPDGAQIAFVSNLDGDYDIYTMRPDGTSVTKLTLNNLDDGVGGSEPPQWSPDGTQILFVSARSGKSDLFVMAADGTDERNLSQTTEMNERHPRWSPDGQRVVYELVVDAATHIDLYTMNVDGSNQHAIESNTGLDVAPEISADGTMLAYSSNRNGGNGDYEVYVSDANGDAPNRITVDTAHRDITASWQPCPR